MTSIVSKLLQVSLGKKIKYIEPLKLYINEENKKISMEIFQKIFQTIFIFLFLYENGLILFPFFLGPNLTFGDIFVSSKEYVGLSCSKLSLKNFLKNLRTILEKHALLHYYKKPFINPCSILKIILYMISLLENLKYII
ncbi:hypothetical protein ACJX0J_031623, partial [Zea mays]